MISSLQIGNKAYFAQLALKAYVDTIPTVKSSHRRRFDLSGGDME